MSSLLKYRSVRGRKTYQLSLLSSAPPSKHAAFAMNKDASSSRPPNSVLPRGASCLICRKRKIKCDGKKPCGPCTRSIKYHECIYDQNTTKKTRVEILQDKVKELEEKLADAHQTLPTPTQARHRFEGRRAHSDGSSPPLDALPLDHLVDVSIPFSTSPLPQHAELQIYQATNSHGSSDSFHPTPPSAPWSSPLSFRSNTMEDDLTPSFKEYLINTFLLHRLQTFVDIPVQSFLDSLNLPPEQGPHPALLNAIYLIACHFSPDPTLSAYEPLFLARARQGLADSLELAERLDDFQIASSLVACYLLFKGRLLEAHHTASSSARFAVSCGLHQILSSGTSAGGHSWNGSRGKSLLPAPGNAQELAGRVNAFWQAFCVDRAIATCGDLPFAFADEDISTYWPVGYTENGTIKPSDVAGSLGSLYGPPAPGVAQRDNPGTTVVKAMALISRTMQFARKFNPPQVNDDRVWTEFKTVDSSITQFLGTLAPIQKTLKLDGSLPYAPACLVFAHTATCHAGIELHSVFANEEPAEYQKCLFYASKIMNVVHEIKDTDPTLWHVTTGLGWIAALRVLQQELGRVQALPDPQRAVKLQSDISSLVRAIQQLGEVFPIIQIELERVHREE